jgi:hypothetical protein
MDKAPFLDDLQQRLSALVEATPAADLQKNLKALLTQQFARLELVTRDEFDTQARVLGGGGGKTGRTKSTPSPARSSTPLPGCWRGPAPSSTNSRRGLPLSRAGARAARRSLGVAVG